MPQISININGKKKEFPNEIAFNVFKNARYARYKQNPPAFLWTEEGKDFLACLNYAWSQRQDQRLNSRKPLLDQMVQLTQ